MLYKIITILLLLSQLMGQSLFNRILPQENYIGDARSKGIGHTYLTNGTTGMLVLSNPAKLSKSKTNFYIHSNLQSITERRSMIILDGFDSYLTETDYVVNQNNLLNYSIGAILKLSQNVGFAFSLTPILSANYNYEEEVRGDADSYDGIIDIRDPLIGYHTFSTNSDIFTQSIGLGFKHKNISLGFSVNQIKSYNLQDEVFVNIIDNSYYEENYMVDDIENISTSTRKKMMQLSEYHVFSMDFDVSENINFVLSYQDGIRGDYSELEISNQLGLPLIFNMNQNSTLEYLNPQLEYAIPEKTQLGILYNSKNNSRVSIAFELTRKKWNYNNYMGIFDDVTNEYRFGFEYDALFGFPVRAGLVYSESHFSVIDPKSIITLGTAKKFNNVILDFALSNMNFDYKYYDLFTDRDIFSMGCDNANCDKIKENQLDLTATIKVNFK